MAAEAVLRWLIGAAGTEYAGQEGAAGGAPPAIELTASIDIRQNGYRGWHPVAGTWDPRAAPFNTHQTVQVRPNGTAFGMEPACGAFPGQGEVTGFNACTDGLEHLPLGRWDYRTVGGTTVDVKYSTNNLVYAQGATELLRLWRRTGTAEWFERARALLHQGVQSSLTEDKRRWLNAHYQSEARVPAQHAFNPDTRFAAACLGGGTEDVLPAWPYRGNWTTKYGAILSMYMLAEALDVAPILARYGGITYRLGDSPRQDWVGALETLDQVRGWRSGDAVIIEARNMVPQPARYTAQVLDAAGNRVAAAAGDFAPAAGARISVPLPATNAPS